MRKGFAGRSRAHARGQSFNNVWTLRFGALSNHITSVDFSAKETLFKGQSKHQRSVSTPSAVKQRRDF
jgi:hypothetical protein